MHNKILKFKEDFANLKSDNDIEILGVEFDEGKARVHVYSGFYTLVKNFNCEDKIVRTYTRLDDNTVSEGIHFILDDVKYFALVQGNGEPR